MACPYCDSADWGYEEMGDGSPEIIEDGGQYITLRRRCDCWECGKIFIIHEEYKENDWYQCLPLEEVRK